MIKIRKLQLSKFFIFSLFASTLGVFIFEACNKELGVNANNLSSQVSPDILKVQQWYEENSVGILNTANIRFKKIVPQWKTAAIVKNSVEVDSTFDNKTIGSCISDGSNQPDKHFGNEKNSFYTKPRWLFN